MLNPETPAPALPLSLSDTQSRSDRRIWRLFRRHHLAFISGLVLLIFAGMAVFADQIMPYDPNSNNTAYARGKPQPPTYEYALGTHTVY